MRLNSKKKAIIDSSFWININRVNLVKELLERFDLYFTLKVEKELLINKNLFYIPKDITVYKNLKEINLINVKDAFKIPINLQKTLSKNSGEVCTIALAIELNAAILVDNGSAVDYCIKNKMFVVNTINFILYCYFIDELTYRQVIEKINQLKPYIKEKYILQNLNLLEKIKGDKDGKRK